MIYTYTISFSIYTPFYSFLYVPVCLMFNGPHNLLKPKGNLPIVTQVFENQNNLARSLSQRSCIPPTATRRWLGAPQGLSDLIIFYYATGNGTSYLNIFYSLSSSNGWDVRWTMSFAPFPYIYYKEVTRWTMPADTPMDDESYYLVWKSHRTNRASAAETPLLLFSY